MTDPILYDIKKLLDAEIGDKKILEQIKRAAENDEVISNYERNFVAKLVEEHLKPPQPEPAPKPEPAVESSEEEITAVKEWMEKPVEEIPSPTIVELKPRDQKNTKIMIGGGAVALAIIIAVAIATSGIQDVGQGTPFSPTTGLTIDIDQSSYNTGDIISISGKSKISLGNTISLYIENADGELIWAEDVAIKGSGAYSTLAIAGGPGWEKSGTYKLKAEHGSENNEISFSFRK